MLRVGIQVLWEKMFRTSDMTIEWLNLMVLKEHGYFIFIIQAKTNEIVGK